MIESASSNGQAAGSRTLRSGLGLLVNCATRLFGMHWCQHSTGIGPVCLLGGHSGAAEMLPAACGNACSSVQSTLCDNTLYCQCVECERRLTPHILLQPDTRQGFIRMRILPIPPPEKPRPGYLVNDVLNERGFSGQTATCCHPMCRYKGVKHFSAGDLLREAVKNGNTELEAIMKEGKLVPVEVTIQLLKDAMLASDGSVFLIDGFPRALDQADVFEKQV